MDRSADLLASQVFPASNTTSFTLPPERSYVPSHEDTANDATNENLDGCEQGSPRLTPVDELLRVEHWKPAEPQFCKEIAAHYGQLKRNIQKWFVDLREIAPWLSEAELRLSDDRYTPLAVELLGHRYFAGSKKRAYLTQIQQRMQEFESLQQQAISPQPLPSSLIQTTF